MPLYSLYKVMIYLSTTLALIIIMTFYVLYIGEIISTKRKKRLEIITSTTGLYLNLLITFLYQANQYVVAPTSGEYAALLGTY